MVEFEGLVNEVKVQVIQENNKKPFLGGFRHRLTGVEYHNASIQTVSKKRLPPNVCHSLCNIMKIIDLYSSSIYSLILVSYFDEAQLTHEGSLEHLQMILINVQHFQYCTAKTKPEHLLPTVCS